MADTLVRASEQVELPENLTYQLIDLLRPITFAALPSLVQLRAKHSLADTLGVAVLGADSEPVRKLKRVVQPGGKGFSTVFGAEPLRSTALDAALINGLASHIMDFDDAGSGGHVSGIIVPATIALAEEHETSGAETLAAMVAGWEFSARLTTLLTMEPYYRGFHSSGTSGTFGAAVAACHLLKLDRDQWAHAIGIAASLAGGLIANFGSMTKGLHSGNSARAGAYAALLAREGFTASTRVLEHERGFIRTHTMTPKLDEILRPLGSPFGLEEMVYKFNASCSGTHSSADGTRKLMREHGLVPEDVDHIVLRIPTIQTEVANIQWPQTVEEGKFSNRFTAAAGVLGINTAEAFPEEDSVIADPKVQELIGRIEVRELPGVNHGGAAEIEMHLRDGRVVETALNSITPFEDLDEETRTVREKFIHNVGHFFGETAATVAADRLEIFENEASVRGFVADLTSGKAS